jgi:hypothetical protein
MIRLHNHVIYQPPFAHVNIGDEVFELSQHLNLPFAEVSNDYMFIPNSQTDNYNNVINFSRLHEPEIYFAKLLRNSRTT